MAQSSGSQTLDPPFTTYPDSSPKVRPNSATVLRQPLELIPLAFVALALLLPFLLAASYFGLPFDDSYISLQFARNLAHHGILSFDGESVSAGATSPLHVALLAIPIRAGVDPIVASVGLGIALHVALIGSVYWLAQAIFRDRMTAVAACIFAAINGYVIFDALNGMETTLFMVMTSLTVAAFLTARSDRTFLFAGLLAALAALTRPEAFLLLGAMLLYEALLPRDDRPLLSSSTLRRAALLAGPPLAVIAGLSLFYYATTGEFTPGTASAKMLFFREFERDWTVKWDGAQSGIAGFAGQLLPLLILAAFSIRRKETLLYLFFWIPFFLLYFGLFPGGLGHYWYRYQHVFLPPLFAFAGAGLVSLLRVKRSRREAVAAALLAVALLVGLAFQYTSLRHTYAMSVNLNESSHVKMALFLRDKLPPDATIAAHDIGMIGYYSEHPVIDLVGLTNPEVVQYHKGRRLREYIEQERPDFVVLFPSWETNFLHLGLHPYVYEPICGFPGIIEPYILYRVHYPGDPPNNDPITCEPPAFVP